MALSLPLENEAEMKRLIRNKEVEFVRLELPDTYGCSRGLHINAPYFLKNYTKGFAKPQCALSMAPCGEILWGTGLLDEISYRDGGYIPDLSTFCVLPWLDKTASVLVDLHTEIGNVDSPQHPASPRAICKRELDKLNSLGFRFYGAFEYEFYLLQPDTKKSVNDTVSILSTQNTARFAPLVNEIMRNMASIGIEPELFHCEYGPSQLELSFGPAFGIVCPDNAFRYKQLVKEIASKHGYMATFMSKPFKDFLGSAGHFNHSLWDVNGKNVFYDPDLKYGLSKIARHWLAGLRYHSASLQCLVSPTPNCFERTKCTGAFAPTNNSWALDNRSVAYRVKDHGSDNIYVEQRLAAAGANPYLVTAGCIIAGMDGIKRELELEGDPYEGEIGKATVLPDHVKTLPKSLSASLDCLENNGVFVEALGPEFIKLYSTMKRYEDEAAEKHRSDGDVFKWYMDYYGEYI